MVNSLGADNHKYRYLCPGSLSQDQMDEDLLVQYAFEPRHDLGLVRSCVNEAIWFAAGFLLFRLALRYNLLPSKLELWTPQVLRAKGARAETLKFKMVAVAGMAPRIWQ